ncbi:hypothetical protein ACLOJK_009385 [Asimina triloba]
MTCDWGPLTILVKTLTWQQRMGDDGPFGSSARKIIILSGNVLHKPWKALIIVSQSQVVVGLATYEIVVPPSYHCPSLRSSSPSDEKMVHFAALSLFVHELNDLESMYILAISELILAE